MASKRRSVGGAIAAFIAGFSLIFRETVGWAIGRILDFLPLPKSADGVVKWEAIPWLNMLAFALLALGVFLFWWGGQMQSANGKSANPYPTLAANARALSNNITTFRATKRVFREMLPSLIPILHQGQALLVSFEKNGFSVPSFDSQEAEQVAVGMEHYFTVIAPMLGAGHIDEARGMAVSLSASAEQRSIAFQSNQWWTSDEYY